MTDKPKSEEHIDDLESQVERGRAMKTLTDSEGWPILKERLDGLKRQAVHNMMTDDNINNIVLHREDAKLIDVIQLFIENTVKTGVAAREQLYPSKAVN
jgi:hypothetical protein